MVGVEWLVFWRKLGIGRELSLDQDGWATLGEDS